MKAPLTAVFVFALGLSSAVFAEEPAATTEAAAFFASEDACADLVLDAAAPARWVVAEPGRFSEALDRRAAARGGAISVVPLRGLTRTKLASLERAAAESVPLAKVRAALDLGAAPFVLSWLAADPDGAASNVVLATLPTLPLAAGCAAVPDGAVFRLAREAPSGTNELRALAARYADFRDALGEALAGAGSSPAGTFAEEARRLAGLLGDELGCLLADAGLRDEAIRAFRLADTANPAGGSALLNLASLAREEGTPEERAEIARRLEALARSGAAGWTLALAGGRVLRPADFFAAGWYWTLSGVPFTGRDALVEALNGLPEEARAPAIAALRPGHALQAGAATPAMGVLAEMGEDGWTVPLAERAAEALFLQNERPAAQRLLWKAAKLSGADAFSLALLRADYAARAADAALARRELSQVRGAGDAARLFAAEIAADVELDDLKAAAGRLAEAPADIAPAWRGPFSVALAKLLAGGGPKESAAARDLLAVAFSADTNFWPAMRVALQADLQSGDRTAAEKDAAALLALRPFDYFGNYVAAMMAAGAGDAAEAQRRYQASLSQRAAWFVLNDYASLLASLGNAALAERMARDALAASGGAVPAVHDTLGEALYAQGRTGDAAAAFREAIQASGDDVDPRFRLHLAEALLATGDAAGAASEAKAAAAGEALFTPAEKDRLEAVRKGVSER